MLHRLSFLILILAEVLLAPISINSANAQGTCGDPTRTCVEGEERAIFGPYSWNWNSTNEAIYTQKCMCADWITTRIEWAGTVCDEGDNELDIKYVYKKTEPGCTVTLVSTTKSFCYGSPGFAPAPNCDYSDPNRGEPYCAKICDQTTIVTTPPVAPTPAAEPGGDICTTSTKRERDFFEQTLCPDDDKPFIPRELEWHIDTQVTESSYESYCDFTPPLCGSGDNCSSTMINCADLPSGNLGNAGTRGDPVCSINLKQSVCDNLPGPSLDQKTVDPNNDCFPTVDQCTGDAGASDGGSISRCARSVCVLQHELNHVRQGNNCPSCKTEGDSYAGELKCLEDFLDNSCDSEDLLCTPDSTSACCLISNRLQEKRDAVNFFACLCSTNYSGTGVGVTYPTGSCEACAGAVSDPAWGQKLSDDYCVETGSNLTQSQFNNTHFSTAQLTDPAISGPSADPDQDGITNLLEYAFNLPPLTSNPGAAYEYYFVNDHFTIKFRVNRRAGDLSYRIGVRPDLFSPWSYSVLGNPTAQDAISFSEVSALQDDAGTGYVIATDSVNKNSVQMRFFKVEAIVTGQTPQIGLFNISAPATSYYQLMIEKSGAGNVSSNDNAISCGALCKSRFAAGKKVILSAAPSPGEIFLGWKGACSGLSTTCEVSMTQARNVEAIFSIPLVVSTPTALPTNTPTSLPTATATPFPIKSPKPNMVDTIVPKIVRVAKSCQGLSCTLRIRTQDSGKIQSGIDTIKILGDIVTKSCKFPPANSSGRKACVNTRKSATPILHKRVGDEFIYKIALPEEGGAVTLNLQVSDKAGNQSKQKRYTWTAKAPRK